VAAAQLRLVVSEIVEFVNNHTKKTWLKQWKGAVMSNALDLKYTELETRLNHAATALHLAVGLDSVCT
jgi:hypothetical protein